MILYLDSSALVKRYVREAGSTEVEAAIAAAVSSATALVTRAEVAGALAKATRVGALSYQEAATELEAFRQHWPSFVRLQLTDEVAARAETLAWEHGLRGYDAVHLAAAVLWQESMGQLVTLATFDRQLWEVAGQIGIEPYPANLSAFLRPA